MYLLSWFLSRMSSRQGYILVLFECVPVFFLPILSAVKLDALLAGSHIQYILGEVKAVSQKVVSQISLGRYANFASCLISREDFEQAPK